MEVKAFDAKCTIGTHKDRLYMYHYYADTWFIFEPELGWVFPLEEEIPEVEILDYMMFTSGGVAH